MLCTPEHKLATMILVQAYRKSGGAPKSYLRGTSIRLASSNVLSWAYVTQLDNLLYYFTRLRVQYFLYV